MGDLSQGNKFKLDDLDQWDVQIAEAGQVISREWYPLRTRPNLAEFCWVFYRGGKRVIVPELEGIRALLAPVRFLALRCGGPGAEQTISRGFWCQMFRPQDWPIVLREYPLRFLAAG